MPSPTNAELDRWFSAFNTRTTDTTRIPPVPVPYTVDFAHDFAHDEPSITTLAENDITITYSGDSPPSPPLFRTQLNTQEAALRELQNNYPRAMFDDNYNRTIIRAFSRERAEIREGIKHINAVKALKYAIDNAPRKHLSPLLELVSSHFRTDTRRFLFNDLEGDTDIHQLVAYQELLAAINNYVRARNRFLERKTQYLPLLAEYNQRSALIRQKPVKQMVIDTADICRNIIEWENVWGVAIRYASRDEQLHIRIGICNLYMEESAPESRYDNPEPILLAPFYITIQLSSDGRFVCPSGDFNVIGLSCGNEPGKLSYDIHPHQLSDSPCFGGFGQTMVDQAANGDILGLINSIIAFYGQYNSQDSAGVRAASHHPACMTEPENYETYLSRLVSYLHVHGSFQMINHSKVTAALDTYSEYHNTCRHNEPPRVPEPEPLCESCEDYPVGDEDDYYLSAHDNRICPRCWENYCSQCNYYHEDCECETENEE